MDTQQNDVPRDRAALEQVLSAAQRTLRSREAELAEVDAAIRTTEAEVAEYEAAESVTAAKDLLAGENAKRRLRVLTEKDRTASQGAVDDAAAEVRAARREIDRLDLEEQRARIAATRADLDAMTLAHVDSVREKLSTLAREVAAADMLAVRCGETGSGRSAYPWLGHRNLPETVEPPYKTRATERAQFYVWLADIVRRLPDVSIAAVPTVI